MVGTKITLSRDGRHKNNSTKGGTDGGLYGRQENNSPNGWMAQKQLAKGMGIEGKFIGRHRDNLLDRKAVAGAS